MSVNVTVEGRVGGDPDIRFTKSGKSVVSFSVVTGKRVKADDGTWSDSETTWWRVTCWDELGENVADVVKKGVDVIVVGRVFTDSWTDKSGDTRESLALTAYNVGVALKRVKVKSAKGVQPVAVNAFADDEGEPPF